MKSVAVVAIIILSGCVAPKATAPKVALPDTDNDNNVYPVDFSTIRVQFQPPFFAYPKEAKEEKIQGVVVIDLLIDRAGKPISAKAIEGPVLLRSGAEDYVMKWQFKPKIIDNHPRIVRFNFNIVFRLK